MIPLQIILIVISVTVILVAVSRLLLITVFKKMYNNAVSNVEISKNEISYSYETIEKIVKYKDILTKLGAKL